MYKSEILNQAADLIAAVGLWAGGDEGGGTCAANAISHAARDVNVSTRLGALDSFVVYLGAPSNSPFSVIWNWNDAEGRTASDVIEALRACAVIEASRERESAEVSA